MPAPLDRGEGLSDCQHLDTDGVDLLASQRTWSVKADSEPVHAIAQLDVATVAEGVVRPVGLQPVRSWAHEKALWARVAEEERHANLTPRLRGLSCVRAERAPRNWQTEVVESRPPDGYDSVTTRVVVADVEGQVEFLRTVFDAVGEVHPGRPAEIRIGDSLLLVTSAGDREPFPAFLYVYVDDADKRYQRALDAGAVSLEEPFDTPYRDRRAMVRDPFGNVFQIAHRRDTTV